MRRVAARSFWSETNQRPVSLPRNRLAATSRLSQNAPSCQTTARPRLTPPALDRTFAPPMFTSPNRGVMSPAMQRTRVDLPAPFSPMRATSCPGHTSKFTSSSAGKRPKLTDTRLTRSSGGPEGVAASGSSSALATISPVCSTFTAYVQACHAAHAHRCRSTSAAGSEAS